MKSNNLKTYWYFILVCLLVFYFSQATGYLDEYGMADAFSCALLSIALIVGASMLGKASAIVVTTVVLVLNLALLIGSKFYFDLYQSYLPFSVLSLVSGTGTLISSFTLMYSFLAVLAVLSFTLLSWVIISRLNVPSNSKLAITFVALLGISLVFQFYHDSRTNKRFQRFSEVPVGYFLRSGGFIPLINGNPLGERMDNINALANSINRGAIKTVPQIYLDAVAELYPELGSSNQLYPMHTAFKGRSNFASDAGEPKVAVQKNVIVFVLESFRASEVGTYGNASTATPFLDSLAKRSLVAKKFYSTAPFTVKSETAINCGVLDNFGGEPESNRSGKLGATCIPGILKSSGYDTFWFHGNTKDFYNRASYLPLLGFNHVLGSEELYGEDYFQQAQLDRRRGTKMKPLLGWGIPDPVLFAMALDRLEQSKQPFYAEIMSLSNHLPFDWEWGIEFPSDLQAGDTFFENYRRGMYYTDAALKGFFDAFEKSNLFDNTLVVITGDHGIWTFDENQKYTDLNKHEQFFRVPFVVFEKGVQPKVITQAASHVDIPPTILSLLGIEVDTAFFGRSLVDEPKKSVPIYSLFDASYSFRLNDEICLPRNRCFKNGPECEQSEEAIKQESEMVCYTDDGEMMFDSHSTPAFVPEQTKTHIDNFLNYAMLGLRIGFVPERPEQSTHKSDVLKSP